MTYCIKKVFSKFKFMMMTNHKPENTTFDWSSSKTLTYYGINVP